MKMNDIMNDMVMIKWLGGSGYVPNLGDVETGAIRSIDYVTAWALQQQGLGKILEEGVSENNSTDEVET